MTIIDKLLLLEEQSKSLEPNFEERNELNTFSKEYSDKFYKNIKTNKSYNSFLENKSRKNNLEINDSPVNVDQIAEIFSNEIEKPGLNPASGGHLGYIPGGGIFASATADYLAAVTNKYSGVYFGSPGAVKTENALIRWLGNIVGYDNVFWGNLTSGGSIANLTAIVTARKTKKINSTNIRKSVIYCSKQVHHCITKGIKIAGLEECILRFVELDSKFRIDSEKLKTQIDQDKKDGLNPFLLIGSAGTTDVGAIDPINELADISEENNLWFHVDAAYGGFFILVDSEKDKFKGIERADSIVLDPHKGLFIPYGLGTVLVKNKQHLHDAHTYTANYMQDALEPDSEPSPAHYSAELTKHFRGLRLWLPLKLYGIKPFKAALEEKLVLTHYFYEEVQKIEGMEVGDFPDLSVMTYRYIPKNGDANEFNKKLLKLIHEDGRVFISSTIIKGNFTLRLACLSVRTHKDTIDLLLEVLREKIGVMN